MAKDNAHVRFKRLHRWIALTATYEELVTRIAEEVHRSYKKNQVFDDYLLDLCRSMDELFDHAQRYQRELEAEMSGGPISGFLGRLVIGRNVSRYKRLVAEQAQDLGVRAISLDSKAFTDSKRVQSLCKRARQCREAADGAWEKIVQAYNDKSKDNNVSAIESILGRADKLAQKMLTNKTVRGALGRFISYKEESRDENLSENERIPIYEQETEFEPAPAPARPAARPQQSSTWLGEQPQG